jgi:hypothetical protein
MLLDLLNKKIQIRIPGRGIKITIITDEITGHVATEADIDPDETIIKTVIQEIIRIDVLIINRNNQIQQIKTEASSFRFSFEYFFTH